MTWYALTIEDIKLPGFEKLVFNNSDGEPDVVHFTHPSGLKLILSPVNDGGARNAFYATFYELPRERRYRVHGTVAGIPVNLVAGSSVDADKTIDLYRAHVRKKDSCKLVKEEIIE